MPVDPYVPPQLDPGARIYERIAELEARMRAIESYLQGGATQQVPVVFVLPTAGRKGRVVMLDSDNLLYRDTGAAWVAV
ncbi:MAG TPA: hypothetical protein VNI55_06565 [Gaiellaceae bacterium]|nr:hypothetical protein [Gaiellaceae bacterium]